MHLTKDRQGTDDTSALLPVASLLLDINSENFHWILSITSRLMAQGGGVALSNMPALFVVGVALGLTENDGAVLVVIKNPLPRVMRPYGI